ncbi:uncharacterized protein RHOBADRAFT_42461 [Rhodotorula graminis WP1]|uniref:Uncharacterized protein n=1 Tax=Rhodotorula graminis (strain WP1) TaxID=578459 RepID=A0A194S9H3_RHOGW|nr:uncharacterized protein RHOBADRAFT_42461 [Rhodotorula graminis WP1]KPV77247.1 hypothetical protein RHOBADRAFT_42461 [Rhodotorula graminis WP1]
MAPLPLGHLGSPASSPPTSPHFLASSPLAPPSPSPTHSPAHQQQYHHDDYAHIVRSLHRRSTDRVSLAALASSSSPASSSRAADPHPVPALEADLRLAAQIGQTLLADKTALQGRLDAAERAKGKLLDRLTASVKEGNGLQRRLEETVANLENADASNRALLVSLEEDRKTISRLSSDAGRSIQAHAQLSNLQRAHDDLRQELAAERRRADAADAKARKLAERATELEERLRRATADLEEMRQDKVLNARRSLDALNRARAAAAGSSSSAKPGLPRIGALAPLVPADGSGGPGGGGTEIEAQLSDNPEAKELLRMVETLARENTLLRSESMELRGLLDDSRDEQCDLRSAMALGEREPLPEEDERALEQDDELGGRGGFDAPRRLSLASPRVPQQDSPALDDGASVGASSVAEPAFTSWTSSAFLAQSHSSRAAELSRTLSAGSSSSLGAAAASGVDEPQSRRIGVGARPPPVTSASTGALGMGRRSVGPAARGHSRRAMSMDVTPQVKSLISSAPTSPRIDEYSPSTRPASIFSNASEDVEPRPRRHHRPLSLSLGPSVFPLVPEDDQDSGIVSPFTRQPANSHRRRSSQAPSLTGLGLGLASPRPTSRPRRSRSPERVEMATQTTPPRRAAEARAPSPPRVLSPSPGPSTPRSRSPRLSRSPSPRLGPAPSSSSSVHSAETPAQPPVERPSSRAEQRTAALGQLIEHAAKLLGRVQGADIATQEKRLRKQNLPGDVRHLAHANLRDLVNEIDSVRTHFRRVVELERAAQARSSSPSSSAHGPPSLDTSLVTRRDFVSLVKLVRDLLFESSRLRMLVNRVQLDPALATSLKDLDVPDAIDALDAQRSRLGPGSAQPGAAASSSSSAAAAATAGGLLAPLSRLFGAGPDSAEQHSALAHKASTAQLRPPMAKRGGSSTVSTATVNVEFGSGQVRQAESAGSPVGPSLASPSSSAGGAATTGRSSSKPRQAQVKRDLASIFAGASSRSTGGEQHPHSSSSSAAGHLLTGAAPIPRAHEHAVGAGAPAGRLASSAFSSAASYIPFGRLLSSYRPALSSTTNAVLDSMPHSSSSGVNGARHASSSTSSATDERPPTLLERQLRPRGLSDSSIRSTFVAHANPHHRLVTAAGLALSAEPARATAIATATAADSDTAAGVSSLGTSVGAAGAGAMDALRVQLDEAALGLGLGVGPGGKSVSRRPSAAQLRAKASSSRLRESSSAHTSADVPPVPPLPKVMVVPTPSSAATSESSLSFLGSPPLASPSSTTATTATATTQPISISPSSTSSLGAAAASLSQSQSSSGHGAGAGAGAGATSLLGSLASSAFGSLAKQATGAGMGDWKERGRMG